MSKHRKTPTPRVGDLAWMRDPSQYPTLRAISPGMGFFRRVPVYCGPPAKLEFLTVNMPAFSDRDAYHRAFLGITHWNFQWEGGPYRGVSDAERSDALAFLDGLEAAPGTAPSSDIVLLPQADGDIYEKWAPLYHLLPRETLVRHGLPVVGRGIWPVRGVPWQERIGSTQSEALAKAFAEHLWRHGLAGRTSPMSAFGPRDPLVLLSHDLAFWRAPMERLIRARCKALGRVALRADDSDPESIPRSEELTFEMPTYGTEAWEGEEEASEVTRDLIEEADGDGRLRALVDAVQSHRVEEDFSSRWSWAREDFERRLYRKRSKVAVRFVEFTGSTPFYDENAELHGNLLCRDLLALVQPRDRQVIVCLHQGHTNLQDIATQLGYANHSPVSKALERIRKRAEKLLND